MDIMTKTYELIDVLDNSELFNKLILYKEQIINNKVLRDLIDKYNSEEDNYIKLSLKQEIHKYEEYQEYNNCYNEIMYIVMDINSRYKDLFNERMCNK